MEEIKQLLAKYEAELRAGNKLVEDTYEEVYGNYNDIYDNER